MMMAQSLKKQAVRGTVWSAIERFATQGASFLIQLVLARFLMPGDYGAIAMLAIFLQIAQTFIDSGFGNALIKKNNCSEVDYSTVFYYNLVVAVGIYLLFFFGAPLVANFYELPILISVMRVISFTLIINALCIVQRTKLIKQIDFRTQTKVSIISVIVSGAIGIVLAYRGFGVWALCAQSILNSVSQLLLLSFYVHWKPILVFSKKSFHEMFNYGSKILGASLIGVVYENLYTIVIGKRFASNTLGLFTRAEQFAGFPSSNIGTIIARVSLPVLSNIQDENERLVTAYRKIIKYASFIIFPLMLELCSVSKPLIMVLLTERWLGLVPFLQILCLGFMFNHLNSLNLNLLYVKGRTDLVLKLEIVKKTIAVAILFGTLPFGVMAMCIGRSAYTIVAVLINTYYTKKLIGLSVWQQFWDITPYLLASVIMAVIVLLSTLLSNVFLIQLLVGIIVGAMVYTIVTVLFFRPVVSDVMSVIKQK